MNAQFNTSYAGFISDTPMLDLFKGFEQVADMARDQIKRELIKTERAKLWREFVKACNKQQYVCLPNQSALPFKLCAGDLWEQTEGSVNRFITMVEAHINRPLTLKELNFIKPQYNKATRYKRAQTTGAGMSWRDGLAKLKELILVHPDKFANKGGFQTHKKTGLFLDPLVKNKIIPKDYGRSFGMLEHNTFNYPTEKEKLKAKLKAREITHPVYNAKLKELREFRNDLLKEIEKGIAAQLRNAHNNSSHFHISQNIKGSVGADNSPGRFSADDWQHEQNQRALESESIKRGSAKPSGPVYLSKGAKAAAKQAAKEWQAPTADQLRWASLLQSPLISRHIAKRLIEIEQQGGPVATFDMGVNYTANHAKL